jgi:hypothetical protein
MKTRDLQVALNTARKLFNQLTGTCESPNCEIDACPFREHICLDVDTVITNIEVYLEEKEK